MKQATRAMLLVCAALGSLAFASSAFATYTPKLIASGSGAGNPVRLGVVVGASDDPTAAVSIYVPNGYAVATPAAGTKLGNVTATASAADLGGAILPLTGELDAIAPTSTTTAQATQCGVTPTQTWDLHLTAAGQTLDIPMFVVSTFGPEAAVGVSKLVVCLPPPDVPAGTPGRATFGAKLLSATFTSSAITEPSSAGDYRWTSAWTPYNPGKGTVNRAGTVEAQSIRHLPVVLHFNATRTRVVTHRSKRVHGKKRTVKVVATVVRFSASVTENGKAPASTKIAVLYGKKQLGGASGTFTATGLRSVKLTVAALVDSDTGSVPTGQTATTADLYYHDLGSSGCTATPIFGGAPCIDATVGGELLAGAVTIKTYTK